MLQRLCRKTFLTLDGFEDLKSFQLISLSTYFNLDKRDCGLDQTPTVMVGETKTTKHLVIIGSYQTTVGYDQDPY